MPSVAPTTTAEAARSTTTSWDPPAIIPDEPERGCGWHTTLLGDSFAESELSTTPVLKAVFDGDLNELERLLSSGGDPDESQPTYAMTALLVALEADCNEAANLLLDSGASPQLPASPGSTAPLHMAAPVRSCAA